MTTPLTDQHPGTTAVDLCRQYMEQCAHAKEKRAAAAALRKEAKAAALRADAFALREKAKSISLEAFAHRNKSKQLLRDLAAKTAEASHLLTARMPPEWRDWGVVKTRAYTSLLQLLVAQTRTAHPKPLVASIALSRLLSHHSWNDQALQDLGQVKLDAKKLQQAQRAH